MSTRKLNCNQRHLIDVLLRCLRKASQRHLLKMSARQIFSNSKKKENFLLLFTYFLFSYIWSKRFHNVTFLASLLQKNVTFLQRVYDVGFTIQYQCCCNNVVLLKSFS